MCRKQESNFTLPFKNITFEKTARKTVEKHQEAFNAKGLHIGCALTHMTLTHIHLHTYLVWSFSLTFTYDTAFPSFLFDSGSHVSTIDLVALPKTLTALNK